MKIFIPIILILLIFVANGFLILNTVDNFKSKPAQASDYSPLDFIAGYDDFSVNIGVSKENGRYASYHYEFSE